MTSPKPDDTPIPLTDDLGDTRALLTPERDPITGASVAGAQQRAAKHIPPTAVRPSAPPPRSRRPRWAIPVAVGAVVLVSVVVLFVATRRRSPTSDTATAPTTTNAPRPTTTAVRAVVPIGPLVGFAGDYQITVDNLYISGASGGFASAHLEQTGATVTARYDDASGSGSATVALPEGPAKVSCAADGTTCNVQWAGADPAVIDGNLGHAVLLRSDGTPLNASKCGLPIPSDGSITPKFGLVDERPQVQDFRLTTGTAVTSGDGCANAVVIGYDIVATRAP